MRLRGCALLLVVGMTITAQGEEERPGINTVLMPSTFKLTGWGSTGTAFVLAKPSPTDPQKGFFVLVTAAHVPPGLMAE